MREYKIDLPISSALISRLQCGDMLYLSGTIYTARDAAHKRLCEEYASNHTFPFDIVDQVIYYVGPTPAKPNQKVGSAGPTSSYRMDKYTPFLLDHGLKIMIGKGQRSKEVIGSMIKNKALYLGIVGGAAALTSKSIVASEVIAYPDLLSEAIHKYTLKDLACILLIDRNGNNVYDTARKEYQTFFPNVD